MWNLIYNNLKILIDPLVFADRSIETISKQVNLIDTAQNYFKKIDPNLCRIIFFFPRFAEERFSLRRTFIRDDDVSFIDEAPAKVIEVIKEPTGESLGSLR